MHVARALGRHIYYLDCVPVALILRPTDGLAQVNIAVRLVANSLFALLAASFFYGLAVFGSGHLIDDISLTSFGKMVMIGTALTAYGVLLVLGLLRWLFHILAVKGWCELAAVEFNGHRLNTRRVSIAGVGYGGGNIFHDTTIGMHWLQWGLHDATGWTPSVLLPWGTTKAIHSQPANAALRTYLASQEAENDRAPQSSARDGTTS